MLIDPPAWHAHGRRWSHLVSDVSLAELHAFAAAAGIPRRGFEGDHYDVPEERYAFLVAAGAVPVPTRELLRRLQASGLRRPKRRGEKVLASTIAAGFSRIDTLLSRLEPPGTVTGVLVAVTLTGPAGGAPPSRLLVLADGATPDSPTVTLPRSDVAAGESWRVMAHRLVEAMLGPGTATAGGERPVQLGYLRAVHAHAQPRYEPVLRWDLSGDEPVTPSMAGSSGAAHDVRWIDARTAGALLPGTLAPLFDRP